MFWRWSTSAGLVFCCDRRPVKMFLSLCRTGLKVTFSRGISNSAKCHQKCSSKSKALDAPWKILFFGNDHFALESLKPLNAKLNTNTLISALGVVTGRNTVVRKFCESEKLPVHEWPIDASSIENQYDLGVVVSFGHLIPKDVIEAFPLGCINVHSSILPKYRGAAPIIHAVMNGDSETGITIMKVHPYRYDVGEIVRQYRIPVSPFETSVELEKRLAVCGGQMVMECLRDLPRSIRMAVPQPKEGVSYAPKIKPAMAKADWSKSDALRVYNLHRALGHMYPLHTSWHGVPVKLGDVAAEKRGISVDKRSPVEDDALLLKKSALDFLNDKKSGDSSSEASSSGLIEFVKSEKVLKVTCKDGNKVTVRRLTVGGKSISAVDFFNGYLSKRPSSEWKFGT